MKLLLLLSLTALAEFDHHRRSAHSCPELCSCSVLPSGAEVVCSRGGLGAIPPTGFPPNTTALSIQYAQLGSLTAAHLSAVPLLNHLQLHRANLVNLSSEVLVSVPRLDTLDLTGNKLALLPASVFSHAVLSSLVMKNNQLEHANEAWFPDNSSLVSLDLSGNRLSSISAALLQKLPLLQALNLDDNSLQEIPADAFKSLRLLETISLAGNKLKTLKPQTFAHSHMLKHLYLQDNQLQDLPVNLLQGLPHLELLLLNRNQLQNLPRGLFDGQNPSFQIMLRGNPWKCDGKMEHLWKWLSIHPQRVLFMEEVMCHGPEALKNYSVANLTAHQLHGGKQ